MTEPTASGAKDVRPPADRPTSSDAPAREGLRWWVRLLLVLAFEAVSVLAVWWALHPDASSSTANPGTVPTFLAFLALALFVLVAVQVTERVPLWTVALAALLVVPALVVGARAADGVALLSADRVKATAIRDGENLLNGMNRYSATLADGRTVTVYSVTEGNRRPFITSRARNYNRSLLQLAQRPFATPEATEDVVVGGPTFARFAYGDDLSSADRTRNWVWLGGALLLWLPVQAAAVSALTRRRGWWQRLGDKDPEDEVLPG